MNIFPEKCFCVALVFDDLVKKNSVPKNVLSLIGTGFCWAEYWKRENMASIYGDRFSDFYDGFDVWFYPESCFEIFKTWFSEYAKKKIKESMEIHKTVAPVLPDCEYKKDSIFYGKKICFTGFYPEDKKRIEKICLALNIYKCPIVSGKTEFLVTGPNMGPSKIKSAQDRKIPIIAAERFIPEII